MAKRPTPGSVPNYQELSRGRFSWDDEGLMQGGGPRSSSSVRADRDLNRMAGMEDTPRGRALEARARNAEGHDAMTRKTEREIRLRKLAAAAAAPGASRLAKDRYRMAKESGMYAKGGSVKSSASKRGDGCATKGKTKGRFV